MKSIRRSLILNVFVLLALSLGSICWLVFHTTERHLLAKQEDAKNRAQRQFEERRDDALARQAQTLADLAHSQNDPARLRQMALPYALLSGSERGGRNKPVATVAASWLTGTIGVSSAPFSNVALTFWAGENRARDFGYGYRLQVALASDVRLDENLLDRDVEAETHEYLQINSEWGSVWRSHTLGDGSRVLDNASFDTLHGSNPRFDDVEIAPGVVARRVTRKAPLVRYRVLWPAPPAPRYDSWTNARAATLSGLNLAVNQPRAQGSGPGGPRGPRPPSIPASRPPVVSVPSSTRTVEFPSDSRSVFEQQFPFIYVQCAWTVEPMHPVIRELADKREQRIAGIETETRTSLADLKVRLIWIGCITLSAMLIGGWLLVGVGLVPLKRLSVAVSKVSEKDFRLPIEQHELPDEVGPLVDRLNKTLSDLQKAFEREKRAVADISHELRTPVTALLTTLEVSLRRERSADAYRETIEDCHTIGKQLSQLVERVLTLARLDAGTDRIQPRSVEISSIIEGCAAIGKPLAAAQGVEIHAQANQLLTINTDPDKLREVLMNLVHNAIEYNRPGGQVDVMAEPRATGGIVLEVSDTGIGIPAEMQDKIFERFYRGDPSRNATGVHAGLGLSIVKEYVDRLGGKLTLKSAVGTGSSFRIELPNLS